MKCNNKTVYFPRYIRLLLQLYIHTNKLISMFKIGLLHFAKDLYRISLQFLLVIVCLFTILNLSSCRCINCDEKPIDKKDPPVVKEPWNATSISTKLQITGLKAINDELLVSTPLELKKYDKDLNLIDILTFKDNLRPLGQLAYSKYIFARGVRKFQTGQESIEFHQINDFTVERSIDIEDVSSDVLALEPKAETVGVFNADGTIYAQPVIRRITKKVAIAFFSISYEPGTNKLSNVEITNIVDLPGVVEDDGIIQSVRYIDNLLYIATKTGGYTIDKDLKVETVVKNTLWVHSFFKLRDTIWSTPVGTGLLLFSTDGKTFEKSPYVDNLGLVTLFDEQIVSQQFVGWYYNFSSTINTPADTLAINSTFPTDNSTYFGMDRLDNVYYMGVQQTVYSTDSLKKS